MNDNVNNNTTFSFLARIPIKVRPFQRRLARM
jgi:hypothetical protein